MIHGTQSLRGHPRFACPVLSFKAEPCPHIRKTGGQKARCISAHMKRNMQKGCQLPLTVFVAPPACSGGGKRGPAGRGPPRVHSEHEASGLHAHGLSHPHGWKQPIRHLQGRHRGAAHACRRYLILAFSVLLGCCYPTFLLQCMCMKQTELCWRSHIWSNLTHSLHGSRAEIGSSSNQGAHRPGKITCLLKISDGKKTASLIVNRVLKLS